MTFEEALKAFKDEKSIRRTKWTTDFAFNINENIFSCFDCDGIFSLEDVLADDWEIVND